MDVNQVWSGVYGTATKWHATLGDGQMVTGGSVNRVGIVWPGSGERWVTAHGWYHVD